MAQNGVSIGATSPAVLGDDDLNEPLLPCQQQTNADTQVDRSFMWQGVRGLWMSMCGYMYDQSTGTWIDGGEPRPEGAVLEPSDKLCMFSLVCVD